MSVLHFEWLLYVVGEKGQGSPFHRLVITALFIENIIIFSIQLPQYLCLYILPWLMLTWNNYKNEWLPKEMGRPMGSFFRNGSRVPKTQVSSHKWSRISFTNNSSFCSNLSWGTDASFSPHFPFFLLFLSEEGYLLK